MPFVFAAGLEISSVNGAADGKVWKSVGLEAAVATNAVHVHLSFHTTTEVLENRSCWTRSDKTGKRHREHREDVEDHENGIAEHGRHQKRQRLDIHQTSKVTDTTTHGAFWSDFIWDMHHKEPMPESLKEDYVSNGKNTGAFGCRRIMNGS